MPCTAADLVAEPSGQHHHSGAAHSFPMAMHVSLLTVATLAKVGRAVLPRHCLGVTRVVLHPGTYRRAAGLRAAYAEVPHSP